MRISRALRKIFWAISPANVLSKSFFQSQFMHDDGEHNG